MQQALRVLRVHPDVIVLVRPDGSDRVRLTDDPAQDEEPQWSPDGRRIAFRSDREGDYDLFVVNSDGSGLRRLTENSARETVPSWSPDGRSIVFASDRDGNLELYTLLLER